MEGMYWQGIEETAARVCDKYRLGWEVIAGGKKLEEDQQVRMLYSDLTGYVKQPGTNLVTVEVSRI